MIDVRAEVHIIKQNCFLTAEGYKTLFIFRWVRRAELFKIPNTKCYICPLLTTVNCPCLKVCTNEPRILFFAAPWLSQIFPAISGIQ